MTEHRPRGDHLLTLAHSPDPDDAFMWWPLTGKIAPDGAPLPGDEGRPTLDTAPFRFRAVPADIELLNRRAASASSAELHDVTALSVRAWADVQDRYIITRCGASFGDGYGPKVVRRRGTPIRSESCLTPAHVRIAVPGRRTTAFLLLSMLLGPEAMRHADRFIEMPFERIIPAVAAGEADAGLVIHEGQLTFADAGLEIVLDTGEWWARRTGLKLPLGVNAVRRDLDDRFGPGTLANVASLLSRSVAHAMRRRAESTAYTLPFAAANARRSGQPEPTLERVDRYCRMYVTDESRDMGEPGREAIRRLLAAGHDAGLCPAVADIPLL